MSLKFSRVGKAEKEKCKGNMFLQLAAILSSHTTSLMFSLLWKKAFCFYSKPTDLHLKSLNDTKTLNFSNGKKIANVTLMCTKKEKSLVVAKPYLSEFCFYLLIAVALMDSI